MRADANSTTQNCDCAEYAPRYAALNGSQPTSESSSRTTVCNNLRLSRTSCDEGQVMMKLLAFAWLATPCAAFALSPCSQNLPDYRNDLRRAAEAAAPGDYALQIFSLPAFVPESAIRLQGNTIAYIEFKSSLWYKGKARDGVSPLRG